MLSPTLLTPAHYTNWMPFVVVNTPTKQLITCRAIPRAAIALHAAVITAGFIFFGWLLYTKAPQYFWFALSLGILTLGGFLTSVLLFFRYQQRRGPVFVYDKSNNRVELPRQGRTFAPEAIDCICLVTGPSSDLLVCQLQLHTKSGAHFLLVADYHDGLEQMFERISSNVRIPARRFPEDSSYAQNK